MNTILKKKNFSFKERLKSFDYAFNGIKLVLASQHNTWIHIFISFSVICAGFSFRISKNEWIAIVLCIGLVMAAEFFNSAIEALVDLVSPDYNEKAGKIKDIAAAAVLLTAITSVITACIIFSPYIIHLFNL